MKQLLLILCSLSLSLYVSAQQSEYVDTFKTQVLYYPLTIEESIGISKKNKLPESFNWNPSRATAFKRGEEKVSELDKGQYIRVNYGGVTHMSFRNELSFEYVNVHSHHLEVLQSGDGLDLFIVDLSGKKKTADQFLWNGKELSFDSKRESYFISKPKRKNKVRVILGDEVLFYVLENNDYRSGWQLFKASPVGKVLVEYPKRGLRKFFRLFRKKRETYSGYVLTSQSKYRRGDTIRTTAYILDCLNREPLNRPITFLINEDQGGYYYSSSKAIVKQKVSPREPGRYEFEWIVGEDFKLDKSYYVNFEVQHMKPKWRSDDFNVSFYVEDYQLDDVKFSLNKTKNKYLKGEKIILRAAALDALNHYATGIQAEVIVSCGEFMEFNEDKMLIPDTLWTHHLSLDGVGPTSIMIPDSIIPNAEMMLNASVRFFTPDGETETKTTLLHVNWNEDEMYERLYFEVDDGWLHARFITEDTTHHTSAILYEIHDSHANIYQKQTITLPYKAKVKNHVESYNLVIDDFKAKVPLDKSNVPLYVRNTILDKDTIGVEILNPNGFEMSYQLFYENELIIDSITTETKVEFKEKPRGIGNYRLVSYMIWGSKNYQLVKGFSLDEYELNISLDVPETTQPGQSVTADIEVRDVNGTPVPNVVLAATVLNSKFGTTWDDILLSPKPISHVSNSPPLYTYQVNYNYSVYGYDSETATIPEIWKRNLALDSSVIYQLYHPDTNIVCQYLPIPGDLGEQAQFFPFIIDADKNIKNIYAIDINGMPVYYYDTSQGCESLFVAASDHNTIRIRTHKGTYTIKDISFKKGYKLVVSIDAEKVENGIVKKARFKKLKQSWTREELRIRERTLMRIQRNSGYLFNTSGQVYLLKGNYYFDRLFGPFNYGSELVLGSEFIPNHSFTYEGNYNYLINKDKVKLYPSELYPHRKFKTKSNYYNPFRISLHASQLKLYEADQNRFKMLLHSVVNDAPTAIRIENKMDDIRLLILRNSQGEKYFFDSNRKKITGLESGKYELIACKQSSYAIYEINCKDNHLSYIRLNEKDFNSEDYKVLLQEIFNGVFNDEKILFRTEDKPLYDVEVEIGKRNLIEDFYRQSYQGESKNSNWNRIIIGAVYDNMTGEPLLGANVQIKGTEYGVITDFDGTYQLKVPDDVTTDQLEISYTGYSSVTLSMGDASFANVMLDEGMLLEEVVVLKSSRSHNRKGLFFGRRKKSFSSVRPNTNTTSSALYGSRAPLRDMAETELSDSAKFMSKSGEYDFDSYQDMSERERLGNYEELLFQYQNLKGNMEKKYAQGSISQKQMDEELKSIQELEMKIIHLEQLIGQDPTELRTDFKDNAFWNAEIITDESGRASTTFTLPDDITTWEFYIVGMDDERRFGKIQKNIVSSKELMVELSVPRFAVEGDSIEVVGQIQNMTKDSIEMNTRFIYNGHVIDYDKFLLGNYSVEKTSIIIPENRDSVTVGYGANGGNYRDGEGRVLQVKQQGSLFSKGEFHVLENDTIIAFFNMEARPIKVAIQNNIYDALWSSLEYLKDYEYGCNEQIASKLIALLLEKDIRKQLNEKFKGEKKIKKAIKLLEKRRNNLGLWGWFKEGNTVNWVSLYVLDALAKAKSAGYDVSFTRESMNELRNWNFDTKLDELKAMDIRHKLEFDRMNLDKFESDSTLNNLEYAYLQKLKHDFNKSPNVDSIVHMLNPTTYGGKYIRPDRSDWYYNEIQSTLLVYDIMKQHGREKEMKAIELYLLKNKGNRHWRNTILAAQVLNRLLSNENRTYDSEIWVENEKIESFPYQESLDKNGVQVDFKGDGPFFLSIYQEFWDDTPKPVDSLFQIETAFYQGDKKIEFLEKAQPVSMSVRVHAKVKGEYVLVEIPIPSGCSYSSKKQAETSFETHREYQKDKVLVYCKDLPVGMHTFSIDLEPRFKGRFQVNPTKVEEMYSPMNFGRNNMNRINIQ